MTPNFKTMEKDARIKKLERDFEFVVSAIIQNEIYIDTLRTVEGAKEVQDPVHKIAETEEIIVAQKFELERIKRYLTKEYEA